MLRPHRLVVPRAVSGGALPRMAGGLALLVAATAARADGWGGSLTLASDKVYRGVSQSDGRPALLLDVNRQTDTGWALAAGVAGPAYGDQGGKAELTLAVNKSWQPSADWALQLGLRHEAYLGSSQAREYSYNEASVSLGWQGRVFASVALAPDTSAYSMTDGLHTGRTVVYELSLHQRLAGRLALDAGIGYDDQRALFGTGYAYGSLGLSWGIGPVQAYLNWIDSRAAARGGASASDAGARWVASVLWSF